MPRVTLEIRTLAMPLVRPFRTSKSVDETRHVMVLRWSEDGVDGWSESAADPEPTYFPEYIASVRTTLLEVIVPAMESSPPPPSGTTVGWLRSVLKDVPGNPIAKAFVESALLDAQLRRHGMPLVDFLGAAAGRIPVGVSVGIPDSIDELIDWVGGYLRDGYSRIKLKIQPGWDLEPVRAVRATFGDDLPLQVDANQAYEPSDIPHLRRLDEFNLLLLEQPFGRDRLLAHQALAAASTTPICLDESISGVHDTVVAIRLGAVNVVNIKPSRVGGYLNSRAIHDVCQANGIPVFCGGTLETAVGRAANLALAGLPGFTLPGDISATSRYYAKDIAGSFELEDGCLAVPTGPGTGVDVDLDIVEELTIDRRTVSLGL
ncbi:o-succinylbenzoate synthase [Actinoallomurus sp. NBC_01490]|uniref:o-succinylbenzoate synthase n=1 Tax=Actinoallomurus sp. NBC_01490 TaxID=2903557 RepID=UPI002E32DB44|nr:o-succinylbenzoate synthase [Actinoallomurus sp. NBC_01490]